MPPLGFFFFFSILRSYSNANPTAGLCKCNGTHASQTEGMDHVPVRGAASCIIVRERDRER